MMLAQSRWSLWPLLILLMSCGDQLGDDELPACSTDGALEVLGDVDVYDVVRNERVTRASLTGTVVDLGVGQPPAVASGISFAERTTHWVRVQSDAGDDWIVMNDLPFGFGVQQGSLADLNVIDGLDYRAHPQTQLEINVNGQLAFTFQSYDIAGEGVPEGVSTMAGSALCEVIHPCGTYTRNSLLIGVDDEDALLMPGEQRQIAAYDAWHGFTEQEQARSSHCADWSVGTSRFALSHHEALFEAPSSN